jgi:hypothetical protein
MYVCTIRCVGAFVIIMLFFRFGFCSFFFFFGMTGFVVGDRAIAWKIGGLYVLYMLYETQLTEKRFKIYLSLEELEQLCILVKELKRHDCVVALKVIKFMLQRKVFLYGCVAINQRSIADSCDKLAAQAASRLHHARNRLLSNLPIQEHLYTDLVSSDLCFSVAHMLERAMLCIVGGLAGTIA